jgi:exosortase
MRVSGLVADSEVDSGKRVWEKAAAVPVLLAVGFGPILYFHLMGMLARPHYQFLLLFPVAVWMLLMSLTDEPKSEAGSWSRVTGILLLGTALLGLVYATWAWSPWVAAVCGLLAFLAVLIYQSGFEGAGRWLPVWIFSGILIPLPFGMDEDLIVRLRTMTTRMTSHLLDEFGVLHQCYANVIELPGKPLFVADACSGIHSLYVLLAMALFLCVFCRRSVIHSVALLLSTFGLVLVENVARIAVVALAWQHRMDFSIGWKHSVLGVLLFVASAVLILTTDQLLLFLFPQDPFREIKTLWTKFSRMNSVGVARKTQKQTPGLNLSWLCIASVFPLVGVTQIFRIPDSVPDLSSLFVADVKLPDLGRTLMPEELEGFRLGEFETIQRVEGDPFGRSSQRWVYEDGKLTIGLSLDYPYDGIKDMTQCYEAVGWKMHRLAMADSGRLVACCGGVPEDGSFAVVEMERELLGHALMVFSSFDLSGKSSALLRQLADGGAESRVENRLQAMGKPDKQYELANPPYFQVHLLARSFAPLTAEEQERVLRLAVKARQLLIPEVLKVQKSSSISQPAAGEK